MRLRRGSWLRMTRPATWTRSRPVTRRSPWTMRTTCSRRSNATGWFAAGANVLGSPGLALGFLARTVAGQPRFDPPAAGEIITTGTVTNAWPVAPGERWTSDYGALDIRGLSISFAESAVAATCRSAFGK